MDTEATLRIVLLVVLIIAVIVFIIQFTRITNNTNSILSDFKRVSHGVSQFLSNGDKVKESITDVAVYVSDKLIERQVQKAQSFFRGNIIRNIANVLLKR